MYGSPGNGSTVHSHMSVPVPIMTKMIVNISTGVKTLVSHPGMVTSTPACESPVKIPMGEVSLMKMIPLQAGTGAVNRTFRKSTDRFTMMWAWPTANGAGSPKSHSTIGSP